MYYAKGENVMPEQPQYKVRRNVFPGGGERIDIVDQYGKVQQSAVSDPNHPDGDNAYYASKIVARMNARSQWGEA